MSLAAAGHRPPACAAAPSRTVSQRVAISIAPWTTLSSADRDAVRGLVVSPRQVDYAGSTQSSVSACEDGDPALIVGLALRVDGAIVGFVVLKRGAAAPDWALPGTVVVSGLRIDASQQGKGIGSAVLPAVAAWIRTWWPDTTGIALTVDEENVAAIRAYANAGWVDHGERHDGRIGPVRRMSRVLDA